MKDIWLKLILIVIGYLTLPLIVITVQQPFIHYFGFFELLILFFPFNLLMSVLFYNIVRWEELDASQSVHKTQEESQ